MEVPAEQDEVAHQHHTEADPRRAKVKDGEDVHHYNYVGDGINGGARVMEGIEKKFRDVLYISEDLRERIIDDDLCDHTSHRGAVEDKHHKEWILYELEFFKTFVKTLPDNWFWRRLSMAKRV